MKLTGEYELTEKGVLIEGQIKGSKIADVRKLLQHCKHIRIYKGDVEEKGQYYQAPHPWVRKYIRKELPDLITPEIEKNFMKIVEPGRDRGDTFKVYYEDMTNWAGHLGVLYSDGDGKEIMRQVSYLDYGQKLKRRIKLCTNSAWVWTADERGNFKIELAGLVNRHIMTVVLSNATKLAKYIDEVLVRVLDHEDKFTEEAIAASSAAGSRLRPATTAIDFSAILNASQAMPISAYPPPRTR